MTMTRSTEKVTRAAQTEKVTRQIRSTGLDHIATVGVDSLSMAKVASEIGVTKSPLYRRYNDAVDLAVDVWEHNLRPHLQQALDTIIEVVESSDPDAIVWLTNEMAQPSRESKALLECMAVARRYDYLLENMELDIDRELTRYIETLRHLPTDIALAYVALVFGGMFVGPLFPSTKHDIAIAFRMWHGHLLNKSLWLPDHEMPSVVRPIPVLETSYPDETLGQLVSATTKVIMRSGYENATANRIARYADKAFSSSYSHFASKDDLMEHAIIIMFRDSITLNDLFFVSAERTEFTDIAACRLRELSTSSASDDVRFFRIEATLAALHHSHLNKVVKTLFSDSLQQMSEITKSMNADQSISQSIWLGTRAAGFGLNLLGFVSPRFGRTNWMSLANVTAEHAMRYYAVSRSAEVVS